MQDNPNIYPGFKRELQNNIFVNGTLAGRGANWGGGRVGFGGRLRPTGQAFTLESHAGSATGAR